MQMENYKIAIYRQLNDFFKKNQIKPQTIINLRKKKVETFKCCP